MHAPLPPSDDHRDLAAALRALPLESPTPTVWPALAEAARRSGTSAPKPRRWHPIGAAAAATAAIALAMGWLVPRNADRPIDGERVEIAETTDADARLVADLVARNQALERALRESGDAFAIDAGYAMAGSQVEELIAAIDGQLAADPDPRNAEVLWRVRLGLLQELSSLRSGGNETLMAGTDGVIAVPADFIVQ
jgi:hypothetical protein